MKKGSSEAYAGFLFQSAFLLLNTDISSYVHILIKGNIRGIVRLGAGFAQGQVQQFWPGQSQTLMEIIINYQYKRFVMYNLNDQN